jgi:hypothetical protein
MEEVWVYASEFEWVAVTVQEKVAASGLLS